ncbi:MAG TPA: signal recognition particle-docking protein FtsY [Syntrophales bacterium]|nr:signal recognition particle-docking protein FtsY [Syntrophales bacterium]
MEKISFFERLKAGLDKTRKGLLKSIDVALLGGKAIDQTLFDELEEILLASDVGPVYTAHLLEKMREQVNRSGLNRPESLKKILRDRMLETLKKSDTPFSIPMEGLFTIMVVGVNGTGKTTTIGKLAYQLKEEGRSVIIAAADTFRAAAIGQLEVWSSRASAQLIKQSVNADPAAVVFDAVHAAKRTLDGVLIVDTAGRLHTKVNLMEELKKMRRIMLREVPGAPHEVFLVLDATTGQNALVQAKMFGEEAGVTGIILTKLDGTAKGGVVLRIAGELNIPIRYIGIGEGIDDLRRFDSEEFVAALFDS